MPDGLLVTALGTVSAAWLGIIAVAKPRLLLYVIIGLAPTQFLFVPISDFFISPADVLVGGAAFGLVIRLATLDWRTWHALHQHRFLILMVASYLTGFVVLGVFARTIVRLPIGMTLSVLACELLRTRQQLARAATALVFAGCIDAAYGLFFIARGTPLHPFRFSGMSDVNFAAMSILTSAAVALALLARTRRSFTLTRPGALGAIALATLSQMAVVALVSAWVAVLRRFVTQRNKICILTTGVLMVAVALTISPVRESLYNRNVREVQADGVARNSADIRWMILETAWRGFWTSPAFGLGYFKFVDFSNTNPDIDASTAGTGYPTHNTYVEVLVEGGVMTFAFFVLHWLQYLKGIPQAIRIAARKRDVLTPACLVGFPIVMVCALFANVLLVYGFWAICGLALARLNHFRRVELPRQTYAPVAGGDPA